MTEITDIKKSPLWPARQPRTPRPVRYAIDPTAFVIALIGAPLVVTALTFWMAFVPVIALVLGGPVYLAFAIPVLLWDLPRRRPTFGRLALLGLGAVAAFTFVLFVANLVFPEGRFDTLVRVYGIMGAIFAPLWAGTFAPLYRNFRQARFAAPLA